MLKSPPLSLLTLVLTLPVAIVADGAVVLDFSADGSVTGFSTTVGNSVEVPIFLRFLSPDASHPDTSTTPLTVWAVRGDLTAGDATIPTSPFTFSSPYADDFGNPSSSTSATFNFNGFSITGTAATAVQLGSVKVQGTTLGNVTTVTLSDPSALDDFGVTPAFAGGFDPAVFATTASTTIAVVPEPSSFLFVGLIGAGALLRFGFLKRKAV